jgi:hypothetical protein
VQTAQQTAAARQAAAQQAAAQAAAARVAAAQAAAKPATTAVNAATSAVAPVATLVPQPVAAPPATTPVARTAGAGAAQTVAGGKGASGGAEAAAGGTGSAKNGTLNTVLTSIFSNGSTNSASGGNAKGGGKAPAAGATTPGATTPSAPGTPPSAPRAPAPPPAPSPAVIAVSQNNQGGGALSNSGLGMAQFNDTILTVMGCGRQGTQVACVSELSNQSKTETLMQSSVAWKDAFLIDDRGDRHEWSMGFFLNVDGDKRVDMNIPYGKSAQYVFVFNDVPAKVTKVTLKSATGGLYVEDIPVGDPGANQTASQTPAAAVQAPAQGRQGAKR